MIDFLRHLYDYMADESCGKCTPCRLGIAKGSSMLKRTTVESPLESGLFHELLELLEGGSLCALGGGIPLPVRNALSHFRRELAPYFTPWKIE